MSDIKAVNPVPFEDLLRLWEKTIDVQMHFNDLQLRIRNFGILLVAAFVGGFGAVMKENFFIHFAFANVPISSLILGFAAVVWLAFYFMDTLWYHPLLIGSVKQGAMLEAEMRRFTGLAGLTETIGANSGVKIPLSKIEIHSRHKSHLFYCFICLVLVCLAVALFYATNVPVANSDVTNQAGLAKPRSQTPAAGPSTRASNNKSP
jgi:hypothetical protein